MKTRFFFLFFISIQGIAQQSWVKTNYFSQKGYPGGNAHGFVSFFTVTDVFGALYRAGTFHDTLFLNNHQHFIVSRGKGDVFIEKLNALGETLWVKQIGGEGDDDIKFIKAHLSGLYAGITFSDSIRFTPQALIYSEGETDFALIRFNDNGDLEEKCFVKGSGEEFVYADISDSKDIYITAAFGKRCTIVSRVDYREFIDTAIISSVIIKMNSKGQFTWIKQFKSTREISLNSLTVYKDKLYLIGWHRGASTLFINNTTQTVSSKVPSFSFLQGNIDGYLIEISATSGDVHLVKRLGSKLEDDSYCFPLQVIVDSKGEIIMGGFFMGQIDGVFNKVLPNNYNAFLIKVKVDGELFWSRRIGGSAFWNDLTSLFCDAADNIWITGMLDGDIHFDDTKQFTTLRYSGGGMDGYLAVYSKSGDILVTKKASSNDFDLFTQINGDKVGNIYLSGISYMNIQIPLWDQNFLIESKSSPLLFTIKTDNRLTSIFKDTCTAIANNIKNYFISNEKLVVWIPANSEKSFIYLTDILGRVVTKSIAKPGVNTIDVFGLSNGVYFLKITADQCVITQKLIFYK